MLNRKKIAILGAGTMGEALIEGLLEAKAVRPARLWATTLHRERAEAVGRAHGIRWGTDNAAAARWADVLVVAVKPKMLEGVLRGLDGVDLRGKLLVSVVASAPTALIERALGAPVPVVRAMPNTPCLRKAGMTAVCAGSRARTEHLRVAEAIFRSVGRCIAVEEEHMDAVTGLSASGPAFIYIVIESLAEAGVKVGLPRRTATELAAQTVLGSARMVLETGAHPALLKDMVTTPAGCTMDGILELEDGGLRVTLIKAVVRATQRAKELIDETALRDSAADRGSRRRRAGAEGVGGGWGGIAAADEGRGRRGVLKANRGA